MKSCPTKFILSFLLAITIAQSQMRYRDAIFNEVTKTEDVIYGNAPDLPFIFLFEWNTVDIDLEMDIYEPVGDTIPNIGKIELIGGPRFRMHSIFDGIFCIN